MKINNRKSKIGELNIKVLNSYIYVVYSLLLFLAINLFYDVSTKMQCKLILKNIVVDTIDFFKLSLPYVYIGVIIFLGLITFFVVCFKTFLLCFTYKIIICYVVFSIYKLYISVVENIFTNSDYFALFSLVVSLLSAVIAALTIMFGNFKICGIGSNTILKHVFKKQFLYCRSVIFISPLVMLVLIFFELKFTYVVLFLLSIVSLIYLLHLCISVFVDTGIRTKVIPEYICDEIFRGIEYNSLIFEAGKNLYSEFIHSYNNDEFNDFSEVYVHIFINLINKCDNYKNERDKYRVVYIFLHDTIKYLLRNSTDKNDVIKYYIELCLMLVKATRDDDDITLLAICQNVVECSDIKEIKSELRCKEIGAFFDCFFTRFNDSFFNIKFSILILFQIEIYISNTCINILADVIYDRIEDVFEIVIIEKSIDEYCKNHSDFLYQRDRIKSILFNCFLDMNRKDNLKQEQNYISKQPVLFTNCIINVWKDLCTQIRRMFFCSGDKYSERNFDFFSYDNDDSKMIRSKVYMIYTLKCKIKGVS